MAGAGGSSAVRVSALLLSMALAGGLIGFGWEQTHHAALSERSVTVEHASAEALLALPPAPRRPPEEEAVLQRALRHFPPYPRGGRPEVLAADYLGPSAPIAVAWLSTEDPPGRVLEHYRRVLTEQGLPTLHQRHGGRAGFVGYWNPASEEVYLVSVLAQGGETLVFVSAAQVRPLLEGAGTVPDWIPLPSNLEQRSALTLGLEGATQYTVSGSFPVGSLQEGLDAWSSVLSARGWSLEVVRREGAHAAELEVRRGQLQGTAMLRHGPAASQARLFLSLMERP